MKKEKEIELLKLHSENLNSSVIADILGVGRKSVYNVLKKYGLKSNNNKPFSPRNFTQEDVDKMIWLYNEGYTCEQIYEKHFKEKCSSYATIQSLLSRRINLRKRGKLINFNENYFESIDTERKAYWLGFIYADGNITGNRLRIEIMNEDKYLLNELRYDMKSSNKICNCRSYNSIGMTPKDNVYIGFCSNKLVKDLSYYGVMPNKTFKIKNIPNINSELIRHFVRGYFDGDGTVYLDNKNHKDNRSIFGFYGQYDFLNEIKNILINDINITNRKIYDKGTVSQVTFSRRDDILNFYNYIYKGATVYLKRKKAKFDIYINE